VLFHFVKWETMAVQCLPQIFAGLAGREVILECKPQPLPARESEMIGNRTATQVPLTLHLGLQIFRPKRGWSKHLTILTAATGLLAGIPAT
jgi:hypothetical protein